MDTNHAALLTHLGVPKVADALGLPSGTVRQWRTRNSIPAHVWGDIARHFPPLTIEELHGAAFNAEDRAA